MPEKKSKNTSVSEWKLLKEASQEVESWPNWLQKNAELLFEEEQEKQRKLDKKPTTSRRERDTLKQHVLAQIAALNSFEKECDELRSELKDWENDCNQDQQYIQKLIKQRDELRAVLEEIANAYDHKMDPGPWAIARAAEALSKGD